MKSVILSADIGTTAVKLAIITEGGEVIASASENYPVITDGTRAEQDPEHWWNAFCRGTKELLNQSERNDFELIVLSGQMQDLVCIKDDRPVGNAILYSDTRAADELKFLHREFGEKRIITSSANLSDAAGLPSKFLWLRKNRPELVDDETFFLMGAHDYICWRLTGAFVTDYTNASTTQLLDFDKNSWNSGLADFIGISTERFPVLQGADEPAGKVSAEASGLTGLPAGLTVLHGAGDAGSSTIGAGSGVVGVLSCYLGTSGWITTTGDRTVDPATGIFNLKHPDPSKVINIGSMITAGGNTEWVVGILSGLSGATGTSADFHTLTEEASAVKPGSNGVFYLPYLSGERSPFRDPDARGAFIGLNRGTGKGAMFRAVLEGVAYSLDSILEMVTEGGHEHLEIRISGGGASNSLWTEIIASVTGCRVILSPATSEAGLVGNLLIAGKASGWFDSFELPGYFRNDEKVVFPDNDMTEFYRKAGPVFRKLYPVLKESFSDIKGL